MVVVVCWTCVGHHCQCPVCLSVVVVLTDDFHRVVTVWVGGWNNVSGVVIVIVYCCLAAGHGCVCVCVLNQEEGRWVRVL